MAVALVLAGAGTAHAQDVAPEFDGSYELSEVPVPAAVESNLGGLAFKAGTTDRLLIGGEAGRPTGALFETAVVRDGDGHITRLEGGARVAEAPYVDGGVAHGPGGVLFVSRYRGLDPGEVGQIRPGSAATDKVIPLRPFGVTLSPGGLTFVPAGLPGAGSLKLAGHADGAWYDAEVVPDGAGAYDLADVARRASLSGGPEGIAFATPGSPLFGGPSLLVSEFTAGRVSAYAVDANGDPITSSRRDFVTDLHGAEGATVDPVTGDLLLTTFSGRSAYVVRGFARPATVAVETRVVNDDGGVRSPAGFTVHVRASGTDVPGSPQPGSSHGLPYTLTPAAKYVVTVDRIGGYQLSIGGDCAADGSVTAQAGTDRVCTVTANDVRPPVTVVPRVTGSAVPARQLPPPIAGERVNAVPSSGTVKVKPPGSDAFVELEEGRQIPVGTVVDARKGRVSLIAAGGQSATFHGGIFRIGQGKGARPLTTLTLVERLACAKRGSASAAAKKKRKRRLWGDGKGRFRTKGEFSSATVRGTKWLVEDRCATTLTRVVKGRVAVRDFAKRKTVIVRAGRKYVARRT